MFSFAVLSCLSIENLKMTLVAPFVNSARIPWPVVLAPLGHLLLRIVRSDLDGVD